MAVKDFGITENKDIESEQKQSQRVENNEQTAAQPIKNAHATGDGSYGRSDDSIPDNGDEDNGTKTDTTY